MESMATRLKWLDRLTVLILRPSSASEVGAAARLMANFAVKRGVLVAPKCDINSAEARSLATGSSAVTLATMSQTKNLSIAVAGSKLIVRVSQTQIGATSSSSSTGKSQEVVDVKWLVDKLSSEDVSLLFIADGERLTDAEAVQCSHQLQLYVGSMMPDLKLSHVVAAILAQLMKTLSDD